MRQGTVLRDPYIAEPYVQILLTWIKRMVRNRDIIYKLSEWKGFNQTYHLV